MKTSRLAVVVSFIALSSHPVHAPVAEENSAPRLDAIPASAGAGAEGGAERLRSDAALHAAARERLDRDLEAIGTYRPGYAFWSHVFTIPDGRIAFGSATDGSLLATFPARGRWLQAAHWAESSTAELFADQPVARRLAERREDTSRVLAEVAGPVVHHATRGSFVDPGVERFGSFLSEWGAVFERFGVPAEIGLAQAMVESGFRGRIRSEAGALGFCQWMPDNWERLKRLSPHVIEGYNQMTQAPYCAAHLAILATKYGSFIPALSEHHAGGVNVGRTIINGTVAGGEDIRESYFLGGELALLLRQLRPPGYRRVVGTYGPRSFRYAELVFGNTSTVASLEDAIPQQRVFAMRARRSIALDEVTRRTGLSVDEVRRFNPSLVNQVPAGANLYLPRHMDELGTDAAFWHRPPSREYAAVLDEFLRLDERYAPKDWDDQSIVGALRGFEARFRATETEEGTVMAVMLAYAIEDLVRDDRREILAEFRGSERVRRLVELGTREREARLPAAEDSGGWARRVAILAASSFAR